MIVKFAPNGQSFKGLAQYLTHDPKAQTSERVAWTHTLNLANDHVPSAVHEMYQTFLDAETLKEEAGIKRGGQPLQLPVKHFSLNWHPDDQPTKEHMLETTQSFLLHMGWEQHQAILCAHDDKAYSHVHVMVNAVHPETGLKLNEGLERRRASEWSLAYELQQEQIRCGQRLLDGEDREKAPTRAAWEAMQEAERAHSDAEAALRTKAPTEINAQRTDSDIWQEFKALQRGEREAFFVAGKAAYKEARDIAFREVREAFRAEWLDYYEAKRDGSDEDALQEIKADLTSRQQEALVERRDQMCKELREQRDNDYAGILASQQAERAAFTAHIAQGGDGRDVLSELQAMRVDNVRGQNDNDPLARDIVIVAEARADRPNDFQSAARDASLDWSAAMGDDEAVRGETRAENPRVRDPIDLGALLGAAAIGEALTFGERLFEGFLDDAPQPKAPLPEPKAEQRSSQLDPFAAAAATTRRLAEEEDQKKRDEWWDDRRPRARE